MSTIRKIKAIVLGKDELEMSERYVFGKTLLGFASKGSIH